MCTDTKQEADKLNGETMTKKRSKTGRGGRPPKPPDEKYRTPARQLGGVADDDWQLLQDAAAKSGKTFTAWAVEILLRNARRQLNG